MDKGDAIMIFWIQEILEKKEGREGEKQVAQAVRSKPRPLMQNQWHQGRSQLVNFRSLEIYSCFWFPSWENREDTEIKSRSDIFKSLFL